MNEATSDAAALAVMAAQTQAAQTQIADHETRLRLVEAAVVSLTALPKIVQDLEDRQRKDERWRYALPLTAVAAVCSAVAAIASVLLR